MYEKLRVMAVQNPFMVECFLQQDELWRTLNKDFDSYQALAKELRHGEWAVYFVAYIHQDVDETAVPIALFGVRAMTRGCCEVMYAFPKPIRGRIAMLACRRMLEAIFDGGEVQKVVGFIPTDNPLSIRWAATVGGKREGLIRDAGIRDGKSYDLVVMTYSKETFNAQ